MELLWAILFVVVLLIAWMTNVVGLPGNWIMAASAIGYWALMPADSRFAFSTSVLIALVLIAAAGEALELAAGSAGVTKAGGSRRSALYAIGGSIGGALVGFLIGVPIPLFGPLIGSLLFGSIGAMAGAIYGERFRGRGWTESFKVGKSAFLGRALGTLAKMAAGLVMIVVVLAALVL